MGNWRSLVIHRNENFKAIMSKKTITVIVILLVIMNWNRILAMVTPGAAQPYGPTEEPQA